MHGVSIREHQAIKCKCGEEISERIIEETGYRWNRELLRDLVGTCVKGLPATENSADVRNEIASELAPFFPIDMLDTSKGSTFYNAVDNEVRAGS